MIPAIVKQNEIRGIGYEIDAEYVRGSEKNAAYWGEIDFSKYPPYPADLEDLGELATWKHPAGENEHLCYYFGCRSTTPEVPEGFTEFTIPAAEYAVFIASDEVGTEAPAETVKKVRQTYACIFNEWLGNGGYAYDIDHGMLYESYKDNYACIYVPVKKI